MKLIVICISLAVTILTIPGYGQIFDSIDLQYLQSKSLMSKILSKKLDHNTFQKAIRILSETIKKDDYENAKSKSFKLGGVDSGGGTLVVTSQTKGLLDLYLYNYKAFNSQEPGLELPETPSYKDHGFDALVNSESLLIPMTLSQIEKWKDSSPIIVNLVTKALKELPIYYVNAKLNFKNQMIYIPDNINLPPGTLDLAAYYLKDMGVFIEKNTFDRLSIKNQMGLLIHEALRHRQLSFESGMSNAVIQKLTALMIIEPQKGMTLDNVTYLNGRILEKILKGAKLRTRAKEKAESLCKERLNTCQVLRGTFEEILENYRTISDYQLTNEFFNKPDNEIEREIKFRREFGELVRTLRAIAFETNPNTEVFEELNFSLKNSGVMFRMAAIAKTYNENGDRFSTEAKVLKSFMSGLNQMGVLKE